VDRGAELSCESARSLVPGYLDGELTEAQAAPLRAHLFACPACRELAKDERTLKQWFSEAALPAVAVPEGFAARVARRAFAGDPGLLTPVPPPTPASHLPFLLKLTAVAAGLLFVFAVAIQKASLPSGDGGLNATEEAPWEREANRAPLVDRPADAALPEPGSSETESAEVGDSEER
jgi:anti-sigma factor RsiW